MHVRSPSYDDDCWIMTDQPSGIPENSQTSQKYPLSKFIHNKKEGNMNINTQIELDRTPYVGQTVLYRSYGTPNGEFKSKDRAAIITNIVNDNCDFPVVDLCVLNPTGLFFNLGCVNGVSPGQWQALRNGR